MSARYVYPAIGFDNGTAAKYWAAHSEERHRAGDEDVLKPGMMRKHLRYFVKGLGLELIVGLLLSCLGDPKTALCPCRVHRKGRLRGIPYGPCAEGQSRCPRRL